MESGVSRRKQDEGLKKPRELIPREVD